jgi:lysophospholipase L1-like esterase
MIKLIITIIFFSAAVLAQKPPITIFLAGDSTCAKKLPEKRPETGWGEMLGQFFDEKKVLIDNHAMNGRSTRTFISDGRWQVIVEKLKKGDFVFIQFGHNDEAKEKIDRYTPPEDFKTNLRKFIADVRAKKATPVLLTPVVRRRFDKAGKFYDTHGEYPDLIRSIAKELDVKLLDLHRKTEILLTNYGVEESKKLFLQLKENENPNYPKGIEDNTHFNPRGAEEVAKSVVEEIRDKKLKLKKYLKKKL